MSGQLIAGAKKDALMFGSRDIVREIAERVIATAPGGNRLSLNEALALAQVAVAHRLSPWLGEIWFLKKEDTPIGVMIGIKGLRKTAQRQLAQTGDNYWLEPYISLDPVKMFMPPDSLVFQLNLHDTQTTSRYIGLRRQLYDMKMPVEEINEILGPRPVFPGIGWYTKGEPTRMKPYAVALKRAEADALKKRFYVPLGVEYSEGVDEHFVEEGEEVEGEFTNVGDNPYGMPEPPAPSPAGPTKASETPEEKQKRIMDEMGYKGS